MKLKLKTLESLRLETDSKQAFTVYVEHGLIHVTAQPRFNPTRVFVADKTAKVEFTEKA